MKFLVYFFLLFSLNVFFAQETSISLDSCIQWTKRNFPIYKQSELYKTQQAINVSAIREAWLPKLNLNASATYQSEVVQFNIPGFTTNFPHDAYIGSLSMEQLIFDGGIGKRQQTLETLSSEVEIQKNTVELYKSADRVNQIYMAILLAKENISMLELFKDNLMQRSTSVAAAVSNGLMLQTNLDEIEVELLKTQQNLIEATENLVGLCASLTLMTGKEITPKTTLSLIPAGGTSIVMSIMRPETKLLLMQESLLDERYKLATNVALPKVYLGAVGNYGRPGPNFINQDLRFFGSGNVSLRWNISTLYGLGREQRKFDLNKKMLEIQRDQLNKNIEISLATYTSQLSALDQLMKLDALILAKKAEISEVSAAQLANGKITSTVYLIQLNDEMAARLNLKIHEIKKINAWSNYNITMGLINF